MYLYLINPAEREGINTVFKQMGFVQSKTGQKMKNLDTFLDKFR